MLWNTGQWKYELSQIANRLEKRLTQKRWTERTNFLVERDIMVSAYMIRKLHEAHKVSDALNSAPVHVTAYKLVGSAPELYSDEVEGFDMEHPEKRTLKLQQLCNQFIHSFVFIHFFGDAERTWEGVGVASDRDRKKNLHYVESIVLIELIRKVAYEDIVSIGMSTDENGERYWHSITGVDLRYE